MSSKPKQFQDGHVAVVMRYCLYEFTCWCCSMLLGASLLLLPCVCTWYEPDVPLRYLLHVTAAVPAMLAAVFAGAAMVGCVRLCSFGYTTTVVCV